jgi:predicted nucleic acid-binding Zn ribbon protein
MLNAEDRGMESEGEHMKCPNCGAEIGEDAAFCPECGAAVAGQQQNGNDANTANMNYGGQPADQGYNTQQADQGYNTQQAGQGYNTQQAGPGYNGQPYNCNPAPQAIPPEYTPISMWGYFGYELLFSIPVIGFIFLIIYAFGGTQNRNLKNFARSYFCFIVIVVVLCLIIAGICGAAAVGSSLGSQF